MRRVMVLGCPGAGKTTVARRLGELLDLPVIELDSVFWRSGWVETPKAEFREAVARLAETAAWIMDGNYGVTYDLRMSVADTIVWLDLPRMTCVRRVLTRIARGYGVTRPGMPAGCAERLDMKFLAYVWNFHAVQRPGIIAGVARHGGKARLHQLRTPDAIARFMNQAGAR